MVARLHVRLIPRAGTDRIEGWKLDGLGRSVLKARVVSIPNEGQANASLIALLASSLDIAPSKVRLVKGRRSRLRTLEIDELVEAQLRCRIKF